MTVAEPLSRPHGPLELTVDVATLAQGEVGVAQRIVGVYLRRHGELL
ncbi:MAG TPA: hypothetical protein VKV40_07530 [Ktedonobacteraceae bacterium]|nr:hypothetical protein [Ktedonobacteraceae bacterium]